MRPLPILLTQNIATPRQARGYGSHSPVGKPGEGSACTWWCHKYRRFADESLRELGAVDERPDKPKAAWRGWFGGIARRLGVKRRS